MEDETMTVKAELAYLVNKYHKKRQGVSSLVDSSP